jgi:adenine-specific DNA-methyltransferase
MNEQQRKQLNTIKGILGHVASFPKNRTTDQTATCLMALLDTEPRDDLLSGKLSLNDGARIRNILDFKRNVMGDPVAENTRESYRKESLKTLCEAGIAERHQSSINDPNTFYTLNPDFEGILRQQSKNQRQQLLNEWNQSHPTRYQHLQETHAHTSDSRHELAIDYQGQFLELSAGKHSEITKQVVDIFAPAYIPGFEAVYISDTRNKMLFVNHELAEELNLELDEHDRLPDLIFYRRSMNIIYPIEVVTSVGPFSESRKEEVRAILSKRGPIQYGVVCITAFPDRAVLRRFVADIAWETKVWIAAEHYGIIHFDMIQKAL